MRNPTSEIAHQYQGHFSIMATKFNFSKFIVNRAKFNVWGNLLKCGTKVEEALKFAGIDDLEAVITESQVGDELSIDASEKETKDDDAATESEIGGAPSNGASEEGTKDDDDATDEPTAPEGLSNGKGETKEDGNAQICFKKPLDDILDWLLSEAEYTCHVLLMARGNVVVRDDGEWDTKYLWAAPGHNLVTKADRPVDDATRRLVNALHALRLLFSCVPVRSNAQWMERCTKVVAMLRSMEMSGGDLETELNAIPPECGEGSTINVKPLCKDEANHDLYLVKNGLFGYVEALQRLLDRMTGLHWNLNILAALNDSSDMIRDFEQVRCMIGGVAASKKITDIRVSKSYVKLFQKAFGNLDFANKKKVMECFYEEHGCTAWHEMDEEFGTNVTMLIQKLRANGYRTDYWKLADEFCWFFMLSVTDTWWRLLTAALRAPEIIPVIVEILGHLRIVTTLRPKENDQCLVILSGVKKLAESTNLHNEDLERNLVRLVRGLLTGKSSNVESAEGSQMSGIESPIIGMTEGLAAVVLPLVSSNLRLGSLLLLSLLDDGSAWKMNWSGDVPSENRDNSDDGSVNAPKLFATIFDSYMNFAKQPTSDMVQLASVSLDLLRVLVINWVGNALQFSQNAIEWFRSRYDALPWTTQCWVFEKLRNCTKEPLQLQLQLPVPRCLVETLRLPLEKFKQVDCDDWDSGHKKVPCALKGLFKMAVFPDGPIQQIMAVASFGPLVEFAKTNQWNEALVDALSSVLSDCQSLREWKNCVDSLALVLDSLNAEAGASLEDSLSSNVKGVRMVAPAVYGGKATMAIIRKAPITEIVSVRNFTAICKEVIVERLWDLEEPAARHAAWNELWDASVDLAGTVRRLSVDLSGLLHAIVDNMKKERLEMAKKSYEKVSKFPNGKEKEALLRKLITEDMQSA